MFLGGLTHVLTFSLFVEFFYLWLVSAQPHELGDFSGSSCFDKMQSGNRLSTFCIYAVQQVTSSCLFLEKSFFRRQWQEEEADG